MCGNGSGRRRYRPARVLSSWRVLDRVVSSMDSKWSAPGSALIVIDVQNDFCPGGALAVPQGDTIIPEVSRLIEASDLVVLTQDWHPRGHGSFASSHAGRQPFETIIVAYGPQTLWPDHCVQGTSGA